MVHRPTPPAPHDVTQLLLSWSGGDRESFDRIASLVYHELKRLAHGRMLHERPGHTLDTTGLVHEAYLRLANVEKVGWKDRNHFLSMAARTMRRILVDHARRRSARKRGYGRNVTLQEDQLLVTAEQAAGLLDLDEALDRLEKAHARPAQAVDLHYFGGLSQSEVAETLGVSQPTVARDLRFALAWLGREWEGS